MTDEDRLKQGFEVRRAVLGSDHVDRAESNKTDLTDDFQNFITRYAWGEIWSRPGLTLHTRSLITISMLLALNRPDELRMHFKAAFNNGVTIEELKEVILHCGLYCGLPTANGAYHLLEEVLAAQNNQNL
jgi:4-carboxymuconolactone decarboxylase